MAIHGKVQLKARQSLEDGHEQTIFVIHVNKRICVLKVRICMVINVRRDQSPIYVLLSL